MKNNQSGRSMVEMLGVLAIIGVLSAGGLAGYSKAMFKHKLNNTMDQITMLVTNIRTMYGTQDSYAGLNEVKAVNLGIVPAIMVASHTPYKAAAGDDPEVAEAATLTNPFQGGVSIAPADVNGANNGFSVTYGGLPKEACIALATADFGSGAGSGFVGALISGASKASGTYGTATEGNAYTMTANGNVPGAIDACSENTSITWTFY